MRLAVEGGDCARQLAEALARLIPPPSLPGRITRELLSSLLILKGNHSHPVYDYKGIDKSDSVCHLRSECGKCGDHTYNACGNIPRYQSMPCSAARGQAVRFAVALTCVVVGRFVLWPKASDPEHGRILAYFKVCAAPPLELGSWVGVRRLFHLSFFLAASHMALPQDRSTASRTKRACSRCHSWNSSSRSCTASGTRSPASRQPPAAARPDL